MKSLYINRLLVLTAVLALFSCADDLNVIPDDAVTTEELTRNDVPVLENGTYESTKDAIGGLIIDFDVLASNFDNLASFGAIVEYFNNNINASNEHVTNTWSGIYSAVFNANVLIEVAGNLSGSEIDQALASAYYLRALCYYNLVTRFGGVPIVAQNTQEVVPRSGETETWNFIIEDLNRALALAPSFSSASFASQESVKALLARVYLSVGDNGNASRLAEEVINSQQFAFEAQYRDVFNNNDNSELIFALSNFEGDIEFWRGTNTTDYPLPGGYNYAPFRNDFDNLFTADDANRKAGTFIEFNGQVMFAKYADNQTIPIIVSRISEMYLISAEAQGLGQGLMRLNELRAGRGASALNPANETEFQEAVALERRREFFGEGFLWYDLIRTGKALETLNNVTSENQLKLPIPQQEVDVANLTQNPGY